MAQPNPLRIGIIGAGQLARMTYQAAISLGLHVRIIATSRDDAAARIASDVRIGRIDNPEELRVLVAGCDVVTFDHEQIDVTAARTVETQGVVFRPAPHVLAITSDKTRQRRLLRDWGCPLPPHAVVATVEDVQRFGDEHGWPVVLKAPSGGYDGRAVWFAQTSGEAESLLTKAARPMLAEVALSLERELAVLVARRPGGTAAAYPVVETVQEDGVLREIRVPAPVSAEVAGEAQRIAEDIAERLDTVGILAVELFLTDGRLLVNEIAARPHNSGHYSIEGCRTSQFHNHLRAVVDWPLGTTDLTAPAVATVNVLGAGRCPQERVAEALTVQDVSVHLYGKEHRPGRKLGHVTALAARLDDALERTHRAAHLLTTDSGGTL